MVFCLKELNVHFGYKQPHAQPYYLSLYLTPLLIILLLVQYKTSSEQPLIGSPQPPLEEDVVLCYLHRDPGANNFGLRALCSLSPPHSVPLSPTHWSESLPACWDHFTLPPEKHLHSLSAQLPRAMKGKDLFNLLLWKGEDIAKGCIAQY